MGMSDLTDYEYTAFENVHLHFKITRFIEFVNPITWPQWRSPVGKWHHELLLKIVFFLSRLASATSVVDALIGVFASTREAREGREKIFFSFQYLCHLVVFGCHSTCSASCIKWFIPANWVFQRWCVEFSSRVVSARDNSWQTTRAKLLVWMLSFHWRPIMSQAVNITVFYSIFVFCFVSKESAEQSMEIMGSMLQTPGGKLSWRRHGYSKRFCK